MSLTYDEAADAAYIRLADRQDHGGFGRTVVSDIPLDRAAINVDFGKDGIVLGIEILGASRIIDSSLLK